MVLKPEKLFLKAWFCTAITLCFDHPEQYHHSQNCRENQDDLDLISCIKHDFPKE